MSWWDISWVSGISVLLLPRSVDVGLAQTGGSVVSQQPCCCRFVARINMLLLVERLDGRRLDRNAIQTHIDADPVQPGCKRRLPSEFSEAAVCTQEDVLRQIAGVFMVAHEAIAQLINRPAMTFDHQIEGARATRQARRN